MYRAVAWKAVHDRVDLADENRVAALAAGAAINVSDGTVTIDGHDVREAIRTPEIDAASAAVARQPGVRQRLIAQQREMGERGGVVMEGRDIGTVVFPGADVKIFLDASPDERARRRASDPAHAAGKGQPAVSDVASALAARDQSDRTRAVSPLAQASDAIRIDTTGVPIDEVVDRVMALVERSRQ
jgi:cytidylate kinase